MRRRHFLPSALIAFVCWLAFWFRRKPRKPIPELSWVTVGADVDATCVRFYIATQIEADVVQRVRDRIHAEMPVVTAFDPITLLAIAGLVLRLLQICQAAAILRQQAAVKRRPTGAVARKIRSRLHSQYASTNPDKTEASIAGHVDAAVLAFAKATPSELMDIKRVLDEVDRQPTEIALFELTEDLSRDEGE